MIASLLREVMGIEPSELWLVSHQHNSRLDVQGGTQLFQTKDAIGGD